MINAKRFYWLAQFIGWGAFCALQTARVYYSSPEHINLEFLINVLMVIVSGISITHLQRYAFIRMEWLKLRLPQLIPRLIVSSLICSILIAILDIIGDYATGFRNYDESLDFSRALITVFAVMLLVLFWNAIYFTFHFFQKSRKQEISNLELVASNKESELKNLRSQLNPHFLFNSLNSIRALVDIEPDKAKMSITTLSNLLRQSLVLGRENVIELERELAVAKNYLDLEKIRFEERLKVDWEIDGKLEDFLIPPFSLQMMVENAIKHGISNLRDGGIVRIKAYKRENTVYLEVVNSGDLREVVDLGVGIQNIKQRLKLQYGDMARFSLEEHDGYVYAKMSFNNEGI